MLNSDLVPQKRCFEKQVGQSYRGGVINLAVESTGKHDIYQILRTTRQQIDVSLFKTR